MTESETGDIEDDVLIVYRPRTPQVLRNTARDGKCDSMPISPDKNLGALRTRISHEEFIGTKAF